MNAPTDASDLLTLSEAAKRLGMKGTPRARAKRLERVLNAHERHTGESLVHCRGAGWRRVSWSELQSKAPFLFAGPDQSAKQQREVIAFVRTMDVRMENTAREEVDAHYQAVIRPQLEELRANDIAIAKRVARLVATVSAAGAPDRPAPDDRACGECAEHRS